MATMRAARFHGNRDVRVEDVPIPQAGPGECLVEVEWCGICGSDLHEYAAGLHFLFLCSLWIRAATPCELDAKAKLQVQL